VPVPLTVTVARSGPPAGRAAAPRAAGTVTELAKLPSHAGGVATQAGTVVECPAVMARASPAGASAAALVLAVRPGPGSPGTVPVTRSGPFGLGTRICPGFKLASAGDADSDSG
jgi:hypothetical protein